MPCMFGGSSSVYVRASASAPRSTFSKTSGGEPEFGETIHGILVLTCR